MDAPTRHPIPLDERLLTRDLDIQGLMFWGIVSGSITLAEARLIPHANKPQSLIRSDLAHKLQHVLHALAGAGVLNAATAALTFDADRRCKRCGTIHAEHPRVLAGGKCFRDIWGGPIALNPVGLRPAGRRR